MPRPDELERTEPLIDGSPLDRLVKQHRIETPEPCADCERARPFADLCPRCFAKAMGTPDDSLRALSEIRVLESVIAKLRAGLKVE